MRIQGKLRAHLEIGKRSFGPITFRVTKGLPVEAILGNGFITKNIAAIYPKRQWIKLEGEGELIRYQVQGTEVENPLIRKPVRVRIPYRITLPAESYTAVRAELDVALNVPVLIRRNLKAFENHGILP